MMHRFTSFFSMLSSLVGLSCFATAVAAQTPSKIPDALTVIHGRKSVRTYLDKPVTKEQLDILLRAGMAAPTAADKRPWAFVVVTDRAVLDKLSNTSQYSKMLTKAGAAIIVCGDTRKGLKSDVWVQDCSAASENILLAAEAIGLGAVWCGVHLNKGPTAHVKQVLGLPAEVMPLNVISIGWPTGAEKPKNKWDPANIHWNRW